MQTAWSLQKQKKFLGRGTPSKREMLRNRLVAKCMEKTWTDGNIQNEKIREPTQAYPRPNDKDELIFVECCEKLGSVCQLLQPAVTFMKTAQWDSYEIRRNPRGLFGNRTVKTIIGQPWPLGLPDIAGPSAARCFIGRICSVSGDKFSSEKKEIVYRGIP